MTKLNNEEDYMWIGGLNLVIELLNITKNDFSKEGLFDLLKLADFRRYLCSSTLTGR